VSEKRDRWIFKVVMAIGLIAFLGIGIAPLVNGVLQANNPTTQTASTASPSSDPQNTAQADLEAQARGYELVLQREPDNETALRGLLEVRLQMQDIPGAIAALEKLVELKPEQTNYAVLLAQAKEQQNDREGAAQIYRQLLETQPGNLNALQGYVNLLLAQDRPEAAIGLLQETLEKAPQANQIEANSIDVVSVQVILGQVYADRDRYDEALAVFEEAIKTDPEDFRPILAKALVFQRQGKNDEAQPLFNTASELAPAQYKDQINQLAQMPVPTQGAAPAPAPAPSPAESSPEETSPE